MSYLFIGSIILLTLKLAEVITISYILVFLPVFIGFSFLALLLMIMGLCAYIRHSKGDI